MDQTSNSDRPRWLRRIAAGVWLLVTVLFVCLWLRSVWRYDRIHFFSNHYAVEESSTMFIYIRSGAGRFVVEYESTWAKHIEAYQAVLRNSREGLGGKRGWGKFSISVDKSDPMFQLTFLRRSGFIWEGTSSGSTAAGRKRMAYSIGFPYWVITLPLLIPPVVIFFVGIHRKRVRWERRRLGQCVDCGYDIRASPGRCPECGAVVTETVP